MFLSAVSLICKTCSRNNLNTLTEPNLAASGHASQSHVLWSYGPELGHDGRQETCSYTTSAGDQGRWWRLGLRTLTSVGRMVITLTQKPQHVVVYVVTGSQMKPCHPLQPLKSVDQSADRHTVYTECRGLSGNYILIKDERESDDYFGVCEVEIFRYQEILSCGQPDTPRYSHVELSGYTATYTCPPGHTHTGTRVAQCTKHGWSGADVPTCQPVTCTAPPPTPHGYIHISPYTGVYTVGTVAVYKCTQGYILWGDERRTCTDQGWTGSLPTCRRLACSDPPRVANTDVAKLDNFVVTYTCSAGYTSNNGMRFIYDL